jgi:hypothetical protein
MPPDRSGVANSFPLAEYGAGLELATSRGWLELHDSGTFVELTQSGYGPVRLMLSEFQN